MPLPCEPRDSTGGVPSLQVEGVAVDVAGVLISVVVPRGVDELNDAVEGPGREEEDVPQQSQPESTTTDGSGTHIVDGEARVGAAP